MALIVKLSCTPEGCIPCKGSIVPHKEGNPAGLWRYISMKYSWSLSKGCCLKYQNVSQGMGCSALEATCEHIEWAHCSLMGVEEKIRKEKAETEVKTSGPREGLGIAWAVLKEHLKKGKGTRCAQNKSNFKRKSSLLINKRVLCVQTAQMSTGKLWELMDGNKRWLPGAASSTGWAAQGMAPMPWLPQHAFALAHPLLLCSSAVWAWKKGLCSVPTPHQACSGWCSNSAS